MPTGLARRAQKALTDALVRDVGNYTSRYATELAEGLDGRRLADLNGAALGDEVESERAPGASSMTVRRWTWSSQNNHVGRADGALRFVVDLARHAPSDGRHVLVWGHSHAGNVLALVTNLLAASDDDLERFFTATRPYYEGLLGASPSASSTWNSARTLLTEPRVRARLRAIPLDLVTFGTPIRYGWDSTGYARLLHVVHHRAAHVRPRRERGFPFGLLDAWRAYEGDYVQRFGIAGTNLAPCWGLRRAARRADRTLHALIQAEVSSRGLFERLRPALRTADEGPVWITDYGDLRGGPLAHLIGHGVYTKRRWMSFHARLVGEWLHDATCLSADGRD